MTNNTNSERATEAGKKKPGFFYQEVPNSEANPGVSDKELGMRWGTNQGESGQKGRTTRKGTRSQSIPGGLEPAQEEQGVQPENSSLDQPVDTGGDRHNLDQPATADDDRLSGDGLDQSGRPDSDRPGESEGNTPEDQRLSYETETSIPPRKEGWKHVRGKRGRTSRQSDSYEVEDNLLVESEKSESEHKYFLHWFDSEGNQKEDAADDNRPSEDPKSEEEPQ